MLISINGAIWVAEDNNRVEIEGYEPIEQTRLAVNFIQRNGKEDGPWCLYLSWGPPHDPYGAVPDSYLEYYRDKEIEIRDNVPSTIMRTLNKSFTKDQIEDFLKGYYAHITALFEKK